MKKKNLFKYIIIFTVMVIPFAFGAIRINDSEGEDALNFIESNVDIVEGESIESEVSNTSNDEETLESHSDEPEVKTIVIDISGEVVNPGVYHLPEGSRVNDAINAAGGLTNDCDINYINRAEIIHDGLKIYIPSKDEETGYLGESVTRVASLHQDSSIDINTAGSEELQKVPGIGPVTAEKIIEYRSANGKFSSIDDLLNISGIGPKTLEKMKGYIVAR